MADTVKRAAATLPAGAICFLDASPWQEWKYVVPVALELERLGYQVRVERIRSIKFGKQRTFGREMISPSTPLARWMVVLQSTAPARLSQWPLLSGSSLDIKSPPTVNPAGQRINFTPDGNYRDFAFFGWSASESSWAWSDEYTGLLAFHPLPLPAGATTGVDLLISAWTAPRPDRPGLQRAVIGFNGVALATLDLPFYRADLPPLRVRISAGRWQEAVAKDQARLQFQFPDAQSPGRFGPGADRRLLGGGFRSIEFRLAPSQAGEPWLAEKAPAALLEDGRFADGWCGPSTGFILSGQSAGPDLLRLRGQVPAGVGYHYPYQLTCQCGDGHRAGLSIPHAGSFDEVVPVPLPPGARTTEVRLLAPQTFRPAQLDARSSDRRDLSVQLAAPECVTAMNPLLVEREAGWYDPEADGTTSWRWTNGQSILSVLAERAGTVVLAASANALVGGNAIEVLVDGQLAAVTPCSKEGWNPVTWRLPLAMGLHRITLRSRLPAVQPPGDSRLLAFKWQDLRWRLEP